MEFFELARARHSVRIYEPGLEISDQELRRIFDAVILSPSSFNVQHWKFVVVRDQAQKVALRGLSFGQTQVEQSAAVVLVCGSLDAYTDANRIYGDADPATREKYVPMIEGSYAGQEALQREEAVRSGSLAAMSLMYAAKAAGWDSGPMIGFDAKNVGVMLHLDENTVPVMMIVIGKALEGVQPERGYRRPVEEVVKLEFLDGDSLI
ncbi:MAG: putative NAD(P)H nitroreductase [Gammaproteobacteria bacterium]